MAESYLDEEFQVRNNFERFDPKYDIFNRSLWDEKVDAKDFFVSYDIANYKPKRSKGFDHWDYALRNASWHMTDLIGERKFDIEGRVEGFTDYYTTNTQGPEERAKLPSLEETSRKVKKAAKILGAGSVGVCEVDQKWMYSHQFNRKTGESRGMDLPESLK